MMAVGDIQRRHRGKRIDKRPLKRSIHSPHGVSHFIRCGEIVKRRLRGDDPIDSAFDRRLVAMDQKDGTGLRTQREQVSGAVVFFVRPRAFVLLDHVVVVLVERVAGRNASLRHVAHLQAVDVDAGRFLDDERCLLLQTVEVLDRLSVHRVAVGIGVARAVDLGPRHMEKAQRISVGQRASFVSVDDVVGYGGDARRGGRSRTKRAKRRESRHTAF